MNCGGIASRASLDAANVPRREIASAVLSGRIRCVRQGWYALPDASADLVSAVRVGGALTSVSAGSHYGLWTLEDGRLHVAVATNASRLRSPFDNRDPLDAAAHGVCVHWRRPARTAPAYVAPLIATLIHAIQCQSEERALVLLDSALNQRLVTMNELQRAVSSLSARYRTILAKCDAGSQSGTETLVRVRLRRYGIRVHAQFRRKKVGRVDLLVGDRLVIECDSDQFHTGDEAQERDYDRDIELIDGDYLVLRLRYRHVVHEWARVEAVILGLIHRGRHLNSRKRA